MTALPAIAALTFNADRDAEAHLLEMNRGRRAGTPIGPLVEIARTFALPGTGRTPTHRAPGSPALDTLPRSKTCHYCGLPTGDGADLHPICALEVSDEPLTAPLHSCPESGAYPCDACNPIEEPQA